MKQNSKTNSLELFINSVLKFIEIKRILINKQEFTPYLINTESLDRKIPLVIRPKNKEEIISIIMLANEHRVQIYPISIGANWGYGSSLPVTNDNIILDLRLMNKIIEINEEHGYAIIEPGVTQKQLSDYLSKNKSKFHIEPTGAGPNTSIIGNLLERGFSLGIYGDRYKSLNNFELILPNGRTIKTGFWNRTDKESGNCFTNAIGPDLRGLFTQSNFGIITKTCFKLTPIPQKVKLAIVNCNSQKDLENCIESLNYLLQQEVLIAGFNISSATRILTTIMQYPWKEANNQTPLSQELKKKLFKRYGLRAWTILVPLRGTKNQVKAQQKDLKKYLKKVSSIKIYNEFTINFADNLLSKLFIKLPILKTIKKLKMFFEFLKGDPKDMTLASPYWRVVNAPPTENRNPAKDNCGLIWMAPTIPFSKKHIKDFIEITLPVLEKYKLDDAISLLYTNKQSLISTLPLLYNKDCPLETKNAHECYEVLNKIYDAKGFYAYRKSIHSMPSYDNGDYQEFIKNLKKHIDSNDIIAPGRYT